MSTFAGGAENELGGNANVGLAIDNKGNVMTYGTAGPSLSLGSGVHPQVGLTSGNLNSVVAKTGNGGGFNVTGVASPASIAVHFDDSGKPDGGGGGPGASGLGLSVNMTTSGAGASTSLSNIWKGVTGIIDDVESQINDVNTVASHFFSNPAGFQ